MLPIAGLLFFRIYENQLVRETERELIAQAGVLAAVFKRALKTELGDDVTQVTRQIVSAAAPNTDVSRSFVPKIDVTVIGRQASQLVSEANLDPLDRRFRKTVTITMAIFQETQAVNSASLQLLDAKGRLIGGPSEAGHRLANLDEVRRALNGRYAMAIRRQSSGSVLPGLTSISRSSGTRVFIGFPVVESGELYGILYMSQAPDSIWRRLYGAREKLTLAVATLLAITTALVLVTSRTIIGPIDALIRQAAFISKGRHNMAVSIKRSGTREIAGLTNSIIDMANALNQRTRYIRAFTVTIGHEFKAPVTAIHGAAELMLEEADHMSVGDRHRFLSNIRADACRIEKLINRLNELARAENPLRDENVIEIVGTLKQFANTHKSVELDLSVAEASPAYAHIPADALELIASNLCTNAAQAGARHLTMTVNNGQTDDSIEISFLDDGPGIDEAERKRIFKPFHTTRRAFGGTGLGLAIVQSLAQAYAGSVRLEDSATGAHFIIELPCAPGPVASGSVEIPARSRWR